MSKVAVLLAVTIGCALYCQDHVLFTFFFLCDRYTPLKYPTFSLYRRYIEWRWKRMPLLPP